LKYNLHTKSFTITITYDEKKTSVDKIIEQLSKRRVPNLGRTPVGWIDLLRLIRNYISLTNRRKKTVLISIVTLKMY